MMKIHVVCLAIAMVLCNANASSTTKQRGLRFVEQGIHEDAWVTAAVERKRSLSIADSTSAAAKQAKQIAQAATKAPASSSTTAKDTSSSSGSSSSGGTTTSSGTSTGGSTTSTTTTTTAKNSMTSTTPKSTASSTTTPKATTTPAKKNVTNPVVTNTTTAAKNATLTSSKNATNTSSNGDTPETVTDTGNGGDGDDDAVYNASYPWSLYEDIQRESNSSRHWNHSAINVGGFMSAGMQKNLSTTKTPFLPSEQTQPKHWPKIVGAIFLVIALGLIATTIIRNIRSLNKRKQYEEIQSLVV